MCHPHNIAKSGEGGKRWLTLSPQHPPSPGLQSLLKQEIPWPCHMDLLVHLPSKLQKCCIEAQCQEVYDIVHTEVCSLREGFYPSPAYDVQPAPPIVSSPIYWLSRFLADVLAPVVGQTTSHVHKKMISFPNRP